MSRATHLKPWPTATKARLSFLRHLMMSTETHHTTIDGGVQGPVLSGNFDGPTEVRSGGQAHAETHVDLILQLQHILRQIQQDDLPETLRNEVLHTLIVNVVKQVQNLEIYIESFRDRDAAERRLRQSETDHYRRFVLMWLVCLTFVLTGILFVLAFRGGVL